MDQTPKMRLNTDKKQLLTGKVERGVLQGICDCSHTQISDKDFIGYQRDVGCNESRNDGAAAFRLAKSAKEGNNCCLNDDLHYSKNP